MPSRSRLLAAIVPLAVLLWAGVSSDPAGAIQPDPVAGPDFNGDGYGDIVLPVPSENAAAGIVHVIPGSATGPQPALSQVWSQDSFGVGDSSEPRDYFGREWAYGDLDGDGYDDLVVGVQGEMISGWDGAGAVHVIYGGSNGLTASGDTIISRANAMSPGLPTGFESFGRSVATGDFNGDGYDDLAVGVGTSVDGNAGAGSVIVYTSGPSGPFASSEFHQNSPGIADSAEQSDGFGLSLASGDWNGDGNDDLAIGIPFEDTSGAMNGGAVAMLRGSDGGITASDQLFSQSTAGIPDMPDLDDMFGYSLAAGPLDGDGRDDLAIGVPGESASGMNNAGSIVVLRGWESGLTSIGSVLINRGTTGVPGSPSAIDYMGLSLQGADFDGNGQMDLAAGMVTDYVDAEVSAGSVIVLYGGSGFIGSPGTGAELWSQSSAGVGDSPESYEYFGWELGAADVNDNGRVDLVAFVPGETVGGEGSAGAAHVLFGINGGLTGSASKLYHQDTPGVGDVAEAGDNLGTVIIL